MNPERFQRVDALFRAAVAVQPEERAALLDEQCGDDDELRREVESLLAEDQAIRVPLAEPATRSLGEQLDELGFHFGGIFPNRTNAGDVLRLQRLNHADVRPGDVAVASPLGRQLLEYVSAGVPDP
jgi:hypothetical protein